MWLFVFFDLPVTTKPERRAVSQLVKVLEKDGFSMLQSSVYIRHCACKENANIHISKIQANIPEQGQISILDVSDTEYENLFNCWGCRTKRAGKPPKQLELF